MSTHGVRPPICADDRWYPKDGARLSELLNGLLSNVPETPLEGELIGVIAPHAGYAFSGQTAAYSYKQVRGHQFRRVVVIGPSHFEDLGPQAVNANEFYETPLGAIPIDADAVEQLDKRIGINYITQDKEHSLEMQLPFLQRALDDFALVPVMMSHPFYVFGIRAQNDCANLTEALTRVVDDKTLLVASSDLSHLHDYEAVRYFDQGLENILRDYDIPSLIDYMVNEGECRACGDVAIVTLLSVAKERGANRIRVLHRTNSGDVTGIHTPGQYTVGYMAAAVYRSNN